MKDTHDLSSLGRLRPWFQGEEKWRRCRRFGDAVGGSDRPNKRDPDRGERRDWHRYEAPQDALFQRNALSRSKRMLRGEPAIPPTVPTIELLASALEPR